jgi:hypothetical protein
MIERDGRSASLIYDAGLGHETAIHKRGAVEDGEGFAGASQSAAGVPCTRAVSLTDQPPAKVPEQSTE